MAVLSRKEQKEQTRDRLVETAETLFGSHGIASTSTAQIAKTLKVSHGTLFVHFSTREALLLAVVERFGERLSGELGRWCTEDKDLKSLLKAHLSVLSEFEDFYLRLILEAQDLPAPIRSIIYSMNASLSYRFYRAAQRLMKDGKIKKIEQIIFFNSWMGTLHYHLMNRDLFSDRTPILKYKGDDILNQFFSLIKT